MLEKSFKLCQFTTMPYSRVGQPLSKENFFPKVVKYYYLQSNSFMNSCMDKKKPWFDFLVAFYHLDLEHCNSISKAV